MAEDSRTPKPSRGLRGRQGATGRTGARGARGPRGKSGPAGTTNITRDEFDAAVKSINDNIQQWQVQFQRIAQMQAKLDELNRVVARLSERLASLART